MPPFLSKYKKAFSTSLTVFALTASAQVKAYLADKSFGNFGDDFPDRIGSISGRVLYTLQKLLNSDAHPFPIAGSTSSPASNKLFATSQLLGDGQEGEFLSIL